MSYLVQTSGAKEYPGRVRQLVRSNLPSPLQAHVRKWVSDDDHFRPSGSFVIPLPACSKAYIYDGCMVRYV